MRIKKVVPAKAKKLTHPQQRLAWIAQGLCGVDGKDPVWKASDGSTYKECKAHVLHFRKLNAGYRLKKKLEAAKHTTKAAKLSGKESRMTPDMVDTIARQVAQNIGGGATVQLPPMTRGDLFNAIRSGVHAATRQVGFRPSA